MLRAAALALVCLGVPGMAAADARLYDCEITDRRPVADWVSERIALVVDDEGSVTVIDSVLIHFEQSPKKARMRMRGETMHVTWSVSNAVDAAQQIIPKMSYSVRLNVETNKIRVRVSPVGFPQNFRGSGTCSERTE